MTIKVTYCGERAPDYEHFAADCWDHPEAQKATARYAEIVASATLEVVQVDLYLERHVYSMTSWDQWFRPGRGGTRRALGDTIDLDT
ncbi:MAG: hypothetical protein EBS23_08095 [Betaproteobacteria bacterium]|nr:hypothetical protein [Betaproteobacteria bacterium]